MKSHSYCVTYKTYLRGYSAFINVDRTIYPDGDATVADPSSLTNGDRLNWCMAALDRGDVNGVVLPKATAWGVVLDECSRRAIVPTISIPSQSFVAVRRQRLSSSSRRGNHAS